MPICASIWPIHAFISFSIGYKMLGHWPKYGVDPDPTALQIVDFTAPGVLLYGICFLSIIGWPFIAIISWIKSRKSRRPRSYPIYIYFITLSLVMFFHSVFDSSITWCFD